MKIFNSLGSNYNFRSLLVGFANIFKPDKGLKLKRLLEKKYSGKVTFYYKGREAIEVALRSIGVDSGFVAINGLTCFVVEKAVLNSGQGCVYLDIGNDLNFSIESLRKSVSSNNKIRAVIIQNTLGVPINAREVKKICADNRLILIEDLAHSVGSIYADGSVAGTVGDFVALSFSQDKIIDAVSGGALITRNKKYQNRVNNIETKKIPITWLIRDILYPFFTYTIRKLYFLNIGKIIHRLLKQLNLLSTPVDFSTTGLHHLPRWYLSMAYDYVVNLDSDITHRKALAKIYSLNLDPKVLAKDITTKSSLSTNVRFPIFVNNRKKLIRHLAQNGIFISDTWYDYPVAPLKYNKLSGYKIGTCPNAEKLSETILNLPTHRNMSENDVIKISKIINKWINIQ